MWKSMRLVLLAATCLLGPTLGPAEGADAPQLSPAVHLPTAHAAAVYAANARAAPDSSAFQWPTGAPAEVLRPFQPPTTRWGQGHRGVDLAHPAGGEILAASSGVVIYAATLVDRPVISIEHTGGLRTTYEPVTAVVHVGQQVHTGQVIGTLEVGHCEQPCLHWGAKYGRDTYIDPLALLQPAAWRLVPYD